MMTISTITLAVALGTLTPVAPQDDVTSKAKKKAEQAEKVQAEREAAFAKLMTGATLVGRFTVDGQDGLPKPERYELREFKKLRGNTWKIGARMKFGKIDKVVPMQLKIKWAGDTPVITMDKLSLIGEEFTFRVLFHGTRYVGTWEHIGVGGGHMFGTIEAKKANEPDTADKEQTQSK